jgi:hypothetical protein
MVDNPFAPDVDKSYYPRAAPMSPQPLQRRQHDEHFDRLEIRLETVASRMKGVETQLNRHLEGTAGREKALFEEVRRTRLEVAPLIADLKGDVALLHEFVYGNGKDGAKIQIDRLERSLRVVGWVGGAIALGIIGQLVTTLMQVVLK